MAPPPALRHADRGPRYLALLLVSLIFLLLVVPIFERSVMGNVLLRAGTTAVLIAGAVTARHRAMFIAFAVLVLAVAAPLNWITMYYRSPRLFLVSNVIDGVFFLIIAARLVVHVIDHSITSVHSLFGAMSAYLLLGLAWTLFYLGLEAVDVNALSASTWESLGSADRAAPVFPLSEMIYFSFVTMSTLGYGDIVPQSPAARSLAWLQSVMGQFFLAVIVAWLVGDLARRRNSSR